MPKRGFAALLITTGALILLLSFKTPDEPVATRPTGVVSQSDQGTGDGRRATPPRRRRPRRRAGRDHGADATATPAPAKATRAERIQDRRRPRRLDPVRRRPGRGRRGRRQAHRRRRARAPDRPALRPDLELRRADRSARRRSRRRARRSTSCRARPTRATPTPSRSRRPSTRPAWDEHGGRARASPRRGRHGHDGQHRHPSRRSWRRRSSTRSSSDSTTSDARFSTYRPDSEVSRLADGSLAEEDASLDVRHVLAVCDHLAVTTGGAFDARHHRSDGRLDPSGYVKGWAIEEAAWLIDSAGGRNYSINAGGDIVARGQAAPGRPWRVGIRHPDRADKVAAVLAVSDRAVATSGSYERGDHIVGPADRSRRRSACAA